MLLWLTDLGACCRPHENERESTARSSVLVKKKVLLLTSSARVGVLMLCGAPCGTAAVLAALRRPPLPPQQDISLTKASQLKKG